MHKIHTLGGKDRKSAMLSILSPIWFATDTPLAEGLSWESGQWGGGIRARQICQVPTFYPTILIALLKSADAQLASFLEGRKRMV